MPYGVSIEQYNNTRGLARRALKDEYIHTPKYKNRIQARKDHGEEMLIADKPMPAMKNITAAQITTLANLRSIDWNCDCELCTGTTKQKETTMADLETTRRDYLLRRLEQAYYDVQRSLEIEFHLRDADAPETANELVQRIKDGKYTIKEGYGDTESYQGTGYIEWHSPDVKKDRPGYEKASENMRKAYTKAKDSVMVKTAEDGLKALQHFETGTYH